MRSYTRTITFVFSFIAAGCGTAPRISQQEDTLPHNVEQISEIKSSFSCDMQKNSDSTNFINAYLRESNIYRTNPFDATSERTALKQGIDATIKYVNPIFFSKFHITPEKSLIIDRYIEYLRPPELVCIKDAGPNEQHAYIFSHAAGKNSHPSVDVIEITSINNKKYINPKSQPEPIDPIIKQFYAETGAKDIPTTGVRVLFNVFRQAPTRKSQATKE